MTNAEMHAIQVQDTPVLLQRSLAPGFKLLTEALVEAADRAGTGSDSQQGLSDFSHFVGAHSGYKHLAESFGDVRFVALVAFKGLRVELAFSISRDLEILESARRCAQIARIAAVAVAFALGATLAPGCSNELVELFTHHRF